MEGTLQALAVAIKRAEEGDDGAVTMIEQALASLDQRNGPPEVKSLPLASIKAGTKAGTFEAEVSVFGTKDNGNDIVEPGAFKRSLSERGFPPIVWSHNWDVPPIGVSEKAEETESGLFIAGSLFVDDHPVARQVYAGMKAVGGDGRPALREFSFGYRVQDAEYVTKDGEDLRHLKDLDLFEVGPTLVGLHPDTRLLGVKTLAHELARASKALTKGTADNPAPNAEAEQAAAEEARARIAALALARPFHPPAQEG
jgi:HK97 family phage prohead protease